MFNSFLAGSLSVIDILLPIGLILIISKLLGIGAKKIGLPQVAAMLLTGILLGLFYQFIPWVHDNVITDTGIEGIRFIAEIGVILIMFSAGLGTDVKQIRATGISALVITGLDVILAIGLGFLASGLVQGFEGTVSFTNTAGVEAVKDYDKKLVIENNEDAIFESLKKVILGEYKFLEKKSQDYNYNNKYLLEQIKGIM